MTTLYALQTPDESLTFCVGQEATQQKYDYLTEKWDFVRVYRVGSLVDTTRVFESDE